MRSLSEVSVKAGANKCSDSVGSSRIHESAIKHVQGSAVYIDDIPEPKGCLFAYPVMAEVTTGKIESIDASAIKSAEGVVAVLSANDIPGHKDIGPVFPGDLLLAEDEIEFHGQAVLLVVATSYEQARKAARLAKIETSNINAVLDVNDGIEKESWVRPPHGLNRGDAPKTIEQAKSSEDLIVLENSLTIGGQEHFYLEGQVSLASPQEDGGMFIQTSSQHPSEVQKLVAEVLHVPFNAVTVEMRRMGGGFGGKETQAAPWACMAALAAHHTGRAVKVRLARSDDFRLTGKRHPFYNDYTVAFDKEGMIKAVNMNINGLCGISPDLSDAIVDRAMFHADNAYYYPEAKFHGNRVKLNTVSHTAYRGFGGPQGMIMAEYMLDDIARKVGKDPLAVRLQNVYRAQGGCDITPYHQQVEQHVLADLMTSLAEKGRYQQRREDIAAFNQQSPVIKRGLALTPVKFGISFTVQHLNQAGALIHIYTDGSIHLNHGGTEMGQGLNTKVAQIVAQVLGVDVDNIHVSATRTDKVPNTSPTAASSGTDLNGMAAFNAANIIKERLTAFVVEHFNTPAEDIEFKQGQVTYSVSSEKGQTRQGISFGDLAQLAYINRVSLSANGYYKTPKIHYDRPNGKGRPFFYYSNGAALAEVEIDTLTGENKVLAVDVLHDVGNSINPALDKGQIEGAFIQGMGWLTTEDLRWDDNGALASAGPATYKIPAIGDTPEHFEVDLYESANPETTVFRSKAVGEPPFMLAFSVWCALRDAVASLTDYQYAPPLDPPATPEAILNAVQLAKQYRGQL